MNQNISFIITTYNGLDLLRKNLPSIIKHSRNKDEIIIIDDCSKDKTDEFLINKFQLKLSQNNKEFKLFKNKFKVKKSNKVLNLKLIVNKYNLRYAENNNRAIKNSKYDYIFLLNNDVEITASTINPLLDHFKDDQVFAVSSLEINPNDRSRSGKNKLWFQHGLFMHSKSDNLKSGETAWACAGSAMYDKQKWLKLGGFDKKFKPAYWEDIDISLRAQNHNWKVLFEAKSKVFHNHAQTNKKTFSQKKIEIISWQNAKKFTLKHSNIWQKISYLLFKPYWFYQHIKLKKVHLLFNNYSYKYWILLILLLATIFRFYRLGKVPAGMTWDEAAIGYNGYAIWNTRRDEWLNFMPISFKSFGDYKASLPIYINALFTFLFGLNLRSVRFPFAIGGVLSVLGLILLSRQLLKYFKFQQTKAILISLISGTLLTISPWHLHYSRIGFESGISLCLTLWAIYFLIKFINSESHKKINCVKTFIYCLLISFLFSATLYAYHSAKIFLPLLLIGLFILFKQRLNKTFIIFFLILMTVFNLPLVYNSIYGDALTRGGVIIFFKMENKFKAFFIFLKNIFAHFSPEFLIFNKATTLRHSPGNYGVLNFTSYFLIVLLFINSFIKKMKNLDSKEISLIKFSIFWIIIGIIPAALGDEVPHSNRALMALPGFILLIITAISYWWKLISKKNNLKIKYSFAVVLILSYFVNFILFQRHYYHIFAHNSADAFNQGYLKAFEEIKQYQKKNKVQKILFTNDYGEAYIYALFANKIDPIKYQQGALILYEFKNNMDIGDLSRKNVILVGSKYDELPEKKADKLIKDNNGDIRFKIYFLE